MLIVFSILLLLLGCLLHWYIELFIVFVASLRYTPIDMYRYFRHRLWRVWNGFGMRVYVGMFGTGKTLSAVRYVTRYAKKYNLNVLSNIRLEGISYTPLVNYKQILDSPPNTIILIDEVSTVFNARSWKDFNINLLFQILQCRKNHKELVCTAQRFAHVDKLMRDITAEVVVCRKHGRICTNTSYDGWDFENVPTAIAIRPLWRHAYVATDALYSAYDTSELIDNARRTDFVSNDDILVARGVTQVMPYKVNRKGRKILYGK